MQNARKVGRMKRGAHLWMGRRSRIPLSAALSFVLFFFFNAGDLPRIKINITVPRKGMYTVDGDSKKDGLKARPLLYGMLIKLSTPDSLFIRSGWCTHKPIRRRMLLPPLPSLHHSDLQSRQRELLQRLLSSRQH